MLSRPNQLTVSSNVKGESHIDFCMQCILMTLEGGGAITNDIVKFRKVIEFES